MSAFYEKHSLIVILGHYGSGKTNFALNLALELRKAGREPLLVDLDVVNPYFRSTDYVELAEREGIEILGPVFGNSNLDAPSLSPGIGAAILHASLERPVILDVGGDPDGARALARYTPTINQVPDKLALAVINARRPETQHAEDNLKMLKEISDTADLTIDALVGNTHLAEFTTLDTIRESLPLLKEVSVLSSIPLLAVTVPSSLLLQDENVSPQDKSLFMPIERFVKTPWQ